MGGKKRRRGKRREKGEGNRNVGIKKIGKEGIEKEAEREKRGSGVGKEKGGWRGEERKGS